VTSTPAYPTLELITTTKCLRVQALVESNLYKVKQILPLSRLTYNMVLNLLRVEEVNPEYMMERSFFQFQNYSNIPKLYKGK